MYTYIYLYTFLYIYIYVSLYVYIYIYVHTSVYIYIYRERERERETEREREREREKERELKNVLTPKGSPFICRWALGCSAGVTGTPLVVASFGFGSLGCMVYVDRHPRSLSS